jgi:hypothetical protein
VGAEPRSCGHKGRPYNQQQIVHIEQPLAFYLRHLMALNLVHQSLAATGMLRHRVFPVDVLLQISLCGKLKLRNCARPGKSCRVFYWAKEATSSVHVGSSRKAIPAGPRP